MPFFIVVTIVMIGLYVTALTGLGESRTTLRIGALTVLMVIHLSLYWCLLWLPEKLSTYVVFLVVQGVLAFALTLLIGQAMLSMGLYAPLVGVAVGSLRSLRRVVTAIVGIVLLAILNVFLLPDSMIPISWFWVAVPVITFVIVYVELYSRQSEAREESQRLLKELETAHIQLSEYAAQVQDLTLANERQRLARELHDTLAQGLVGLILQLEAVSSHLENGNKKRADEIIRQAMSRARSTLADARRAIGDLRQMGVLPDDLVEIIHTEVQRFTKATGIPCEVDAISVGGVSEGGTEHARRIVAEALMNIARHAQADKVWLSVSNETGYVQITIRDNGIGFDQQAQTPVEGHYGLLGMRERARLAGGNLDIDSILGSGTTVVFSLPLAEQLDGE
jgi:NarL family two-component system sensor histidine kinase YdfH